MPSAPQPIAAIRAEPSPAWRSSILHAAFGLLSITLPLVAEDNALRLRLEQDGYQDGATLRGSVSGMWAADRKAEEQTVLRLVWVDAAGRVVQHAEMQRPKKAPLDAPLAFEIKLSSGVGRAQRVVALAAARPRKRGAEPTTWRNVAEASFTLDRTAEPWPEYLALAHAPSEPKLWEFLKRMGVRSVVTQNGVRKDDLHAWSEGGVSVIAGPLVAPEHDPLAEMPERWQAALEQMATRKPGALPVLRLFDDAKLQQAQAGLETHWMRAAVGLELSRAVGITGGTDPFEFTPGPVVLDVFRAWLRQRYPNLAALNTHWGTAYAQWEHVRALTTDEVKAAHDSLYAERLRALLDGDPTDLLDRRNGTPYFTFAPGALPPPGGENFAAWCDWRAFLEFAYARVLGEYRSWTNVRAPGTPAGLFGTPPLCPWSGLDWGQLQRTLDWCVPEGGSGCDRLIMQSLHPTLKTLTRLESGTPVLRRLLWAAWLAGDDGVVLHAAERLMQETGEPTAAARELARDLRILTGGLTRQRTLMQPGQGQVALYFSPRSQAVHWMLDTRRLGSDWLLRRGPEALDRDTGRLALRAWTELLGDLGYRPGLVRTEDLLEGKVRAKVLVLPKVLCLSAAEAEALKEFARLGGTVIADSQCGVFDGSGRRRERPHRSDGVSATAGILDEAFGLRRTDFWAYECDGAFHGDAQRARVFLEDHADHGPVGPRSSELRVNEPGIRVTGGHSCGRTLASVSGADACTSAMVSRTGGLGRLIYLNLALQDYPRLRQQTSQDFAMAGLNREEYERDFGRPTGGEALRVLVGDVLAEALGEPVFSVRTPEGQPVRGVERRHWKDGAANLIALLPPARELAQVGGDPEDFIYRPGDHVSAPEQSACVHARRKVHWYDVTEGNYLNLGFTCATKLNPHRATLLAALPYKVLSLRGKARRIDSRGVFRFELELQTSRAGLAEDGPLARHVVRMELFDPQGRHLPHYDKLLDSARGRWEDTLALAFNEPVGNYRAFFRETLTGASSEMHLFKDSAGYEACLPPQALERRWTVRVPDAGIKLELAADGVLLLRHRVELLPEGAGLSLPPDLRSKASKPWKLEALTPADAARPDLQPELDAFVMEIAARVRLKDLVPESAGRLELTLRSGGVTQAHELPFRVALVPLEEHGAIEVDGVLKDKSWKGHAQAGAFVRAQDGLAAAAATLVYLRRGETHLYVGVDCRASEARKLEVGTAAQTDAALDQGECFEVRAAPDTAGAETVRVRINPAGRVCDAQNAAATWNLECATRGAAAATQHGWSAELAIPWKDLGFPAAPKAGQSLRLGFLRRHAPAAGPVEQSTWRSDSGSAALGHAIAVGKNR